MIPARQQLELQATTRKSAPPTKKSFPSKKKIFISLTKTKFIIANGIHFTQSEPPNAFPPKVQKKLSSCFIDHHSYTTLSSHFQRAILKKQMILCVHHTALKKISLKILHLTKKKLNNRQSEKLYKQLSARYLV